MAVGTRGLQRAQGTGHGAVGLPDADADADELHAARQCGFERAVCAAGIRGGQVLGALIRASMPPTGSSLPAAMSVRPSGVGRLWEVVRRSLSG